VDLHLCVGPVGATKITQTAQVLQPALGSAEAQCEEVAAKKRRRFPGHQHQLMARTLTALEER
jgi:quercetin dioxygenase-like cupin family protein